MYAEKSNDSLVAHRISLSPRRQHPHFIQPLTISMQLEVCVLVCGHTRLYALPTQPTDVPLARPAPESIGGRCRLVPLATRLTSPVMSASTSLSVCSSPAMQVSAASHRNGTRTFIPSSVSNSPCPPIRSFGLQSETTTDGHHLVLRRIPIPSLDFSAVRSDPPAPPTARTGRSGQQTSTDSVPCRRALLLPEILSPPEPNQRLHILDK